ncbi:RNA-directed DNA polymerase [Thiocystis violacea]|uniref:RNA-directed DNA polymerase n=1 Tax=Thiocystis violacea TaxID=13725 RepID=UPI001F5B24AE|nr:RNA-directed DNA polymerase [Thiocystis violacea]
MHHLRVLAAWDGVPPARRAKVPTSPPTKAEVFSVARAGHQRRATSIPNPVAQAYLCRALVANWAAIVRHFRRSKISASHPRFRRDSTRAAALPSMQTLYERRLLQGAGYRYVLRTDISRFFPTIYTHSIPWALHGKAISKKNRAITPKYYGNLLDLVVRQCQDGQTFGLPIGPDTSHIIAECIATAIDVELGKRLRATPAGFRYVDDYYFFFESYSAAESALAQIVRCLKDFELQINFDKTRICKIEELDEDAWTHKLRSFAIAHGGQKQRTGFNHYFDLARELARSHRDESVMVYALRRAGSVIVRKENWPAFEAQLCLAAMAHPVALQTIARLLSTYSGIGYAIDKRRLSRLVNAIVQEHAPLEHHSEVTWCLWMCKELRLTLSPQSVDLVAEMNSSICVLILLDLAAAGRLPKLPAPTRWRNFEHSDALWEDLWMLSYEAGVRGWGGMSDVHIRQNEYFEELRQLDVRFYNDAATLMPLFAPKPDALKKHNAQTVAELLEIDDLDDVFEHEDDEDVYGSPIVDEDDEGL